MKRILADTIFAIHFMVVVIVLFGWAFPKIWSVYMAILLLTLISNITFGYCFLSKLEFDLRKKINPNINYDYNFSTYYTYKFTNHKISNKLILNLSYIFIIGSIIINLYLHQL